MTAKKPVAKKSVAKKPVAKKRIEERYEERYLVCIDLTHKIDVELDVVNGDVETAVQTFIDNELAVDIDCNEHMGSSLIDSVLIDHEIASSETVIPDHVDASAGSLSIAGSGEDMKELVESLREAYDNAGMDMPKHFNDMVFSIESQLGIV